MNNIKFEGLGLDLNINPVMVDINGIKIYWYAFIIIMGVAVCLLLCRRDDVIGMGYTPCQRCYP